jgi:hypothetical protein
MASPYPPPPPAEQSPAESPEAEPTAAMTGTAAMATRPKARRTLPAEPAVQQRAVAALLLALLSLFGLLGLNNLVRFGNVHRLSYVVACTLLVAALAIRLASTSLARARRGGTRSPRGSVLAIVIGSIGVLLSAFLLIGFAVFSKQLATYSRCLSGASTNAAQQACQNQLTRAVKSQSAGQ